MFGGLADTVRALVCKNICSKMFTVSQTSDPVILLHLDAHKREVNKLILETLEQCQVHSKCSINGDCYGYWKTRDKTKSKKQRTMKKEKYKPEEITNHEKISVNICGIFVSMNFIQMSHSPKNYKLPQKVGVMCVLRLPG